MGGTGRKDPKPLNVIGMVIAMLKAEMFEAKAARKAWVSPRSVFNLCELQYLLVDKVKLTKSVSVKFLSFFHLGSLPQFKDQQENVAVQRDS